MVLPPGRDGLPVPGIDDATDPELARAAGELNAWIDYLLHPESNDGPRIYRDRHLPFELEVARRDPLHDGAPADYETRSVLEKYAGDVGAFFRPAQAVGGVSEPIIEQTYTKLARGFFTWDGVGPQGGEANPTASIVARYQEMNAARGNWQQMRTGSGWIGREAHRAHEFEIDFILFQLYTENCFYVVAEHLVRYRAIFKKASEDITNLMFGLTDKFATFNPSPSGGTSFDMLSIVVTGFVAVTTMVITAGAGTAMSVVALATAVEMLGEAAKTAESRQDAKYQLESNQHLREVARQYLDAVNKIEQDTATAIKRLVDSLRIELDKLRAERVYEALSGTGRTATAVPHYPGYLKKN